MKVCPVKCGTKLSTVDGTVSIVFRSAYYFVHNLSILVVILVLKLTNFVYSLEFNLRHFVTLFLHHRFCKLLCQNYTVNEN